MVFQTVLDYLQIILLNLLLLMKNVNFPAIKFVYNGEMINNKTRHVHLQSDGGWYNNISGIYENGI